MQYFYHSVSSTTGSRVLTLNSIMDKLFWFGGLVDLPVGGDGNRWKVTHSMSSFILTNEGASLWPLSQSDCLRPECFPWCFIGSYSWLASLWTRVTPFRSSPARGHMIGRSPGQAWDWSECWRGRGFGSLWITCRHHRITSWSFVTRQRWWEPSESSGSDYCSDHIFSDQNRFNGQILTRVNSFSKEKRWISL